MVRQLALVGLLTLSVGVLTLTPMAIPAHAVSQATEPIPCRTYTVQPGDWLANIAEEHGFSAADLLQLNPSIQGPDFLITPGQVLLLPEPLEATALPGSGSGTVAHDAGGGGDPAGADRSGCQTYVVQPGDWVDQIADLHGISLADLLAANPTIEAPDFLITPGQVLLLPLPAPSAETPAVTRVSARDSEFREATSRPTATTAPAASDADDRGPQETATPGAETAAADLTADRAAGQGSTRRESETVIVAVVALVGGVALGVVGSWAIGRRRYVRLG